MEMNASGTPLSARALFLAMKGALQAHDLKQSLKYFRELKVAWASTKSSEPILPQSMMSTFVDLAWNEDNLGQLILEMKGLTLPEKTVDLMLAKCVGSKNSAIAASIESLARSQRTQLLDSTYDLLIKAMVPQRARKVVEEVLARKDVAFAPDLAISMIDFCSSGGDVAVVDKLYSKMKPKPINVLKAFVWFYIGAEQFERVCDIYELDMEPVISSSAAGSISLEASLKETIVDAAVVCGRTHLAERVIAASSSTVRDFGALWREARQLGETMAAMFGRWNAAITYWVVLVF